MKPLRDDLVFESRVVFVLLNAESLRQYIDHPKKRPPKSTRESDLGYRRDDQEYQLASFQRIQSMAQ